MATPRPHDAPDSAPRRKSPGELRREAHRSGPEFARRPIGYRAPVVIPAQTAACAALAAGNRHPQFRMIPAPLLAGGARLAYDIRAQRGL